MDDFWFNRAEVELRLPPDTIAFDALTYDYELAAYCLNGQPFTGFTVQRHPDGALESVVTFHSGVEDGVSVGWYASGQIEQYTETRGEMLHGLNREWDEDGELVTDEVNENDVRVSSYGSDDD